MTATCTAHGAPAVATCERCGVFLCEADRRTLDAHVYCERCVVLPEVDYLERYRLEFWGKRRDGWSWLFLIGGLINTAMVVSMITRSIIQDHKFQEFDAIFVAVLVPFAIAQLGWFFKQRWARVLLPVLFLAVVVLMGSVAGLASLPGFLIPALVIFSAFNAVRSRLFFEIEVPRETLKKDWSLYHDNPIARAGMTLSLSGLLIPGFAVAGLVCGLIGLRRVDPQAMPPVGNKRAAQIGVAFGVLGTLGWLTVAVVMYLDRG